MIEGVQYLNLFVVNFEMVFEHTDYVSAPFGAAIWATLITSHQVNLALVCLL